LFTESFWLPAIIPIDNHRAGSLNFIAVYLSYESIMQIARHAAHQNLTAVASFYVRSKYFQLHRMVRDNWVRLPNLKIGNNGDYPELLAESVTPLFTDTDPRERPLLEGKNQNLQLACRSIDGRILGKGQIFSFWKQVGPPWASRGFVTGREVREGCVVPSIGGGLCQLSSSLLEVASLAGLEILERLDHTALPADLRHHPGRDATVFWNYVDLRFRAPYPVRLECCVTKENLVVAMRATRIEGSSERLQMAAATHSENEPRSLSNSCFTCGETSCARHQLNHK
jgi:vancomycin resistance protein YoaR